MSGKKGLHVPQRKEWSENVSQTRRNILRGLKPRGRLGAGRRAPGIAAAITSQKEKSKLPTHISLNAASCGLAKDSVVLLEQVRTLDKRRLKERMGELDSESMSQVNNALSVSFGL